VPQEPTLRVASAEPPSLLLDRSTTEGGPSSVLPLDPATGQPGGEFPLPTHPPEYFANFVDRAPRTRVVGSTLFVVVDGGRIVGCRHEEALYGVDLGTGMARPPEPLAPGCGMSLIKTDDTGAMALTSGGPDTQPALLRVDPRTGDGRRTELDRNIRGCRVHCRP
jgi:hypothetical protein